MAKKKVFVGLSGGVDSSVSAALLQKVNSKNFKKVFGYSAPKGFSGFDVSGVFIKVWQPDFWGGCTMKEDRLDAMRVCAKLGIPFYTLDLEKEYKKEVVDYMIAEYMAGRTPNPDIMCNKHIKFGGFFDWAIKNGADYVATGHYARAKLITPSKNKKNQTTLSQFSLLAGKDKNKDQTYFLWTLTQKQLAKTLFPVGYIKKPEVRKLAKGFGLETAQKKDSQGLCFIGKVDMVTFLRHFLKTKEGIVLNEQGENIGVHEGVEFYTIGQRHGFKIFKKTTHDQRYFVIEKNIKKNTLVVSTNPIRSEKVEAKEIKITEVNWLSPATLDSQKEYLARIRYRQTLERCYITKNSAGEYIIKFKYAQKAPTAGQSVVFYDGEECLGGGIIV